MTDTERDYDDLRPSPYADTTGYYENHTHGELIRACERKDRNIRRLDAMILVYEQRAQLAESRAARLEKQIQRLWMIAETELDEREGADGTPPTGR